MNTNIVYGTAWKRDRTAKLVVAAFLQGFRAIDTACQPKHYREDLVGLALDELHTEHGLQRKDYFLQTKFTQQSGHDHTQPLPYDPATSVPEQVRTSLAKSLHNLRTDYLDAYLLHGPLPTLPDTLAAWRTFVAAQDAGTVHMIGICNVYDVPTLHAIHSERRVQIVQNRWYQGNHWDREVYQYCKTNHIAYQSFWTLTGSPNLLKHPAVVAAARKLDVTPAQVIFRFAQLHGITPLTGTSKELHMQQDLAAEHLPVESVKKEMEDIAKFIWED